MVEEDDDVFFQLYKRIVSSTSTSMTTERFSCIRGKPKNGNVVYENFGKPVIRAI